MIPRRGPGPQAALLLFGIAAPLAVFSYLGDEVRERERMAGDFGTLRFVHAHGTDGLDFLMRGVSFVGVGAPLALVAVALSLLLLRRQKPTAGVFLVVGLVSAQLIAQELKVAFHRPRPQLWTPAHPEGGFAFPSAHATQSMALASALVFLAWRTRWRRSALIGGSVFVLLVGISRVYLGAHYPSDVLGGWCVALAWVTTLWLVLTTLTAHYGSGTRAKARGTRQAAHQAGAQVEKLISAHLA